MRRLPCLLLLLTCLAVAQASIAQSYPVKPIRVIVGFPPGSAVDVVTRALSAHVQKQLGQPLLVELRPGAGGSIAAHAVINATPDGYTVHFGLLSSIVPALVKTGAVDARRDLAPISDIFTSPFVFYTSAKVPVTSLQELIAYAKAKPANTLNFASTTPSLELMMELVKRSTGITYTTINYPGGAAVVPPMINGEVAMTISVFGLFVPHLEAGSIRALFVTGPKRVAQYPAIPAAAEVGIPNLEAATSDLGFWAPRGTPKEIIDKLSRTLMAAVREKDVADMFLKQSYEGVGSTPEAQLRRYEATFEFWTNTARLLNFQPQ